MAEAVFFDFLNRIAARKESFPVTILYGYNEFLGDKIIDVFCRSFIEVKSDFNYHRYYSDIEGEANWEEIVNEANSSSFFLQSRKIIVVTIREEKYLTLKKNEKEILKEYVSHPNPNTILVIYISLNLIKDDYKQVKKLKIDKFIKELVAPRIYSIDLDRIQEREVKNYIQSYLKMCGISITVNALDKLMEMREDDFASVLYQLPKLAIADVQDGNLDSGDIDTIITGVEAHSIWDLADAIENEDAPRYLKILNYLFINGIKAGLIIGTLITHYNKIYIAKFLLKRKMSVGEIGRALEQHPFFLDKFINSARNFSEKRLSQILNIIYSLDYESKTSGEDSARLSLQNFAFRIRLMNQK